MPTILQHFGNVRWWIALMVVCWPPATSAQSLPQRVDPAKAAAAGIRRLESTHLTLYTDLPSDAEVDRLPDIFDQAVPQWADYLEVPPEKTRHWHMQAFLIDDRARFEALGLMPEGHDNFRHGFSLGNQLWLYEQPTPYYRRHLLLHEGTHGFMASLLGGCGAGWYMEGTAELLATHHLDEDSGRLKLRHMPRSKQEVPMLGRIKLVRDAFAERRALGLERVLQIDNRRFLDNEQYAWCWALARFLDDHPRYRQRFRSLKSHVTSRDFNAHFRKLYADDRDDLACEWQLFVASLEHGFDVPRHAIEFRRGRPLSGPTAELEIATDRGWQSSGILLEAGTTYRLAASGRFQLGRDADGTWWCEPNGITIEYHRGRPLGRLLGAVDARSESAAGSAAAFLHPEEIGTQVTLTPQQGGTLYLRVNDSPAGLADNQGRVTVTVETLP